MIRAGVIVSLGDGWQGGVNCFNNLIRCYQRYPDPALKLVLFASRPVDGADYPLCVNNSETSTPSTITVGAEKEFSPS